MFRADMLVTFQKSRAASIRINAFFVATRAENGRMNEDVNRSHWSSASAEQERARLIELFSSSE